MNTLNEYFSHIVCIHLPARLDRAKHALAESDKHNFRFKFFDAYPAEEFIPSEHGRSSQANAACTASHRAVLEVAAFYKWPRTLILEDDFEFVVPDANAAFREMIGQVPEDWDMLYLGGSYAEDPKRRVSPHVIHTNGMMTTSSYAVTWRAARKMAPHIYGECPIDSLYHKWNRALKCFCFDPRMAVQMDGISDIQGCFCRNSPSMLDAGHVTRLDAKAKL